MAYLTMSESWKRWKMVVSTPLRVIPVIAAGRGAIMMTAESFPVPAFTGFLGTMTRTDLCEFSHAFQHGLLLWRFLYASCREHISQTSPGKSVNDNEYLSHTLMNFRATRPRFTHSRKCHNELRLGAVANARNCGQQPLSFCSFLIDRHQIGVF